MKFSVIGDGSVRKTTDCVIVGLAESETQSASTAALDEIASGMIALAIRSGDFCGRQGETILLHSPESFAQRVLLVGLGKLEKDGRISRSSYCFALDASAKSLLRTGATDVINYLALEDVVDTDGYYRVRYAVESLGGVLYRASNFKAIQKLPCPRLKSFFVAALVDELSKGKLAIRDGRAIVVGQNLMRDLANLPANVCTPEFLANSSQELGRKYRSVSVRVFGKPHLQKLQMGAFLAVAEGSDEPPNLIVARYQGASENKPPIVLVGKGVTFDTGGISLKPPLAMDEMKFDMSGAACVFGTLKAVAELQLPINLVAVVPACENMPGPRATRPGDIVTTMSGYTVEILNTDAEGRLILCDALTYARRFKPDVVIDVATLTGACVVALGRQFSGLFSNNSTLARQLLQAGERSNDLAWQLPLTDEFFGQLESNFADFANVAGREGGASIAAAYLAKFVDGLKWAHLDIAGSTYAEGDKKGSTGRPVSLLVDYLLNVQ